MLNFQKFIKTAAAGLTVAVVMSSAAAAATLTLGGAPTLTAVPGNFDLLPEVLAEDPSFNNFVSVYQGATGGSIDGGLSVSAATNLKITFLGKEAGATNTAIAFGGSTLLNTGAVGSSIVVGPDGPGIVTFAFETIFAGPPITVERINNGGTTSLDKLALSYSKVFNGGYSVLAFFGDGRGDNDLDDMLVRIDVVPLPASALLLLGGIGGLGALRMRKKKA